MSADGSVGPAVGDGAAGGAGLGSDERALGSSYALIEVLYRDGFGEVWRGRVIPTSEPVSVRVLGTRFADDPELVARFIHARSAWSRVVGPHVVPVRDLVIEGTTLAVVSDPLPGTDLRMLANARAAWPSVDRLAVARQLADGLCSVHAAGLVHGGLGPEVVRIEPDDSTVGGLRLSDFAVAGLVGRDASVAADLAALGAVLDELTPEVREPGDALGERLDAIVRRLRVPGSTDRPVSAAALVHELDALATAGPAVAPAATVAPGSRSEDVTVVVGDRRMTVGRGRAPRRPARRAGAVVVVVAMALGGLVAWNRSRPSPPSVTVASAAERYDPGPTTSARHTVTALGDAGVRVDVTVEARAGRAATIAEYVPAPSAVRRLEGAHVVAAPSTGHRMVLRVPPASTVRHVSYRVATTVPVRTIEDVLRYERARARQLESDPSPYRPAALASLTAPTDLTLRQGESAWLHLVGEPTGGRGVAARSESERGEFRKTFATLHWDSSDPGVAVVRAEREGNRSFPTVDAVGPGRATLTTTVAGRPILVDVEVRGRARPGPCEPGAGPAAGAAVGGSDVVPAGTLVSRGGAVLVWDADDEVRIAGPLCRGADIVPAGRLTTEQQQLVAAVSDAARSTAR